MKTFIILLISINVIYDACSIQFLEGQRELYGILVLAVVFYNIFYLKFLLTHYFSSIKWIIFLSLLFFFPILYQPVIYVKYILGDYASVILPFLFLLCGYRWPSLFSKRYLLILGIPLFIASLLALNFRHYSGRFEAPPVFLFVIMWSFYFNGKTVSRIVSTFFLLILFLISFNSGERTNLLSFLISGLLVFSMQRISFRSLFFTSFFIIIILYSIFYNISHIQEAIYKSRYRMYITNIEDKSLTSRLFEVQDVLRTAEKEWHPIQYLLGYGYGATYKPYLSYIKLNVLESNRVHHIHVGIAMIFFRYGIIGLFLYFLLCTHVIKEFLTIRKESKKSVTNNARLVFTISIIMYLINLMFFNIMVDPLASFSLAGFLFTKRRRIKQIALESSSRRIDISNFKLQKTHK